MTTTPKRPRTAGLAILLLTAFAASASAQDKDRATFPSKGFKQIKLKEKQRKKLHWSLTTGLTNKNVHEVTFERPEGYDETVITDGRGKVLGRSAGQDFAFADRTVGDRFVIYIVQSKKRRYLKFREGFVEYSGRNFPGKDWQAEKLAELRLKKVKQFTPKTMAESFDKPHKVYWSAKKAKTPVVYLLARIEADGTHREADQSLTGELEFWAHAKKGETFVIYELHPASKTYRVSKTMAVDKDYPLGK